jgi:GrpB-like predicted nucleotidyltransferase (UPF0157 family)/predicted house-cleaning noncanonical NTP pyrophosphatase (MazG superfamily)
VFFKFLSEKLVRDKTVERYENQGGNLTYRILEKNEDFERELYKKLLEEAKEVITAKNTNELISELADMQEVLLTIAQHNQISAETNEDARISRRELRGGFSKKIYSLIGTISETSELAPFIQASPEKYVLLKEFSPQKELSNDSGPYKYLFGQLKTELFEALPRQLLSILHIGSTSIRNLPAQPTIDILAAATSLLDFDCNSEQLRHLGWTQLGEYGIENRRLFARLASHNEQAIAYLHVFEKKDPNLKAFYEVSKKIKADPQLQIEFTQIRTEELVRQDSTAASYAEKKQVFFKKILTTK